MTCRDIQQFLPLYQEGHATPAAQAACEAHLPHCPVCRAEMAELRTLAREMSMLSRPTAPAGLATSINYTLKQAATMHRVAHQVSWQEQLAAWLRPRLMPYAVSSVASLLLFMVTFAALRSSLTAFHDWGYAERVAQAREYERIYNLEFPGYDINSPITSEGLALVRRPVTEESPTLNPKGALVSLMRSLTFEDTPDEMMVVADIFSDGNASLADVVQPPRDPRLLQDVQRALRKNPAFVPASYDNRPETIRVVLVVQSVDVK